MSSSLRASLLITILSLGLVAAGFWAGRKVTVAGLRQSVAKWQTAERLDAVIGDQDREAFARAYLDPAKARAAFHDYSWMPLDTMTPFVMHMPRIGPSANANIGVMQVRGPDQPIPGKPVGTLRVLMTGGSTLYGSGAPSDAATIPAFVGAELRADPRFTGRRVEVCAFAVPGWSTTHERIVIENRIADLEPDLVVSFSGANDIRWASQERNVLWMRSFSDQFWFELVNQVLDLGGEARLVDVAFPESPHAAPETVAKRLCRNVELARCVLERERVPYLWVLQPMLPLSKKALSARERRWLDRTEEAAFFVASATAIRARFAQLGKAMPELVDLTGIFDAATAEEELFLDTVHFGDRGNLAIAKRLAPTIAQALAPR